MMNNPALDQKMREEGYVPAKVLADATQLAKATINTAARQGKVRSKRVGSRVYIELASFRAHWPVFDREIADI